ncbi:hypothetical protein BZA70DRAFT_282139 [Myxozyma melibiosi]|uniref:SMP-30/Gluconolactonase/LRE-like region domain-containing protein n=1 Tax=Myxozyma melibiosi TaxID=54550 RepID=A0ABR1F1V6_9ASCO
MSTAPEYHIDQPFLTPHNLLGEGPTYVPSTDEFFFLDIHRCQIAYLKVPTDSATYTVAPSNEAGGAPAIEVFSTSAAVATRTTYPDSPIGVLALLPDSPDRFLVGAKYGFAVASPKKNAELEYKADVYASDPEKRAIMRFNDGNVDPAGRFVAGSMKQENPTSVGSLFKLETDGTASVIFDECAIPNGLQWSADGKTMFHIESTKFTVFAYDYDVSTGTVSNKRPFVVFDNGEECDGMTISEQGDLFIAVWNGRRVEQRCSKTGALKAKYFLPAARVTCPTFGGKNLDELYVTTASLHADDLEYVWTEEDAKKDQGGEIFKFKIPGQNGVPRGVYKGSI